MVNSAGFQSVNMGSSPIGSSIYKGRGSAGRRCLSVAQERKGSIPLRPAIFNASVAQWSERSLVKRLVEGSSPSWSAIYVGNSLNSKARDCESLSVSASLTSQPIFYCSFGKW